MTDGAKIANSKFSSSSDFNASSPASNGRLNYTEGQSWCALSSDSTPYLEVDLGSVYILCAVATQGNSQGDQWVKTYQIKSSEDKSKWKPYTEKGQDVVRKQVKNDLCFWLQKIVTHNLYTVGVYLWFL